MTLLFQKAKAVKEKEAQGCTLTLLAKFKQLPIRFDFKVDRKSWKWQLTC